MFLARFFLLTIYLSGRALHAHWRARVYIVFLWACRLAFSWQDSPSLQRFWAIIRLLFISASRHCLRSLLDMAVDLAFSVEWGMEYSPGFVWCPPAAEL